MLLSLAQAVDTSAFVHTMRDIAWIGAMINVLHLLALSVFAGALLIVDLRLMGAGLTREPLAEIATQARPWLIGGFLGLVVTGIPQLALQPVKEYYSDMFNMKMKVMLVAIIFTFVVRAEARANGRGPPRAHLGQARRACLARALGGRGHPGTVDRVGRLVVVAIAPPALPFVLAPPPPAEIDREDDDDQRGDKDYIGQLDHSDGVTGAGIEPAARALKVRCSTTELPGLGCWRRSLLYSPGTGLPFTLYLASRSPTPGPGS